MQGAHQSTTSNLIRQLPTAIGFIASNFEIVDASNHWLRHFNVEYSQVIGANIIELFPEEKQNWVKAMSFCLDGHQEFRHQQLKNLSDEKVFEFHMSPWYDENQLTIGMIVQIEDISELLEQELRYEKMESLLKAQSTIAKIGTWELDLKSNKPTWSEMTRKIHEVDENYEPTLEEGINFYKIGYSRNKMAMLVHRAIEKNIPYSEKLQIVTAKGNEKWVLASGKAFFTRGKPTKLIGTFQDITAQVKAEKKTKQSEELLNTLVNNLPINVYIKDTMSRKLLVNKAECNYLGYKPENLIGKNDFDVYDSRTAEISRNEDLEVLRTKSPILGRETISVRKDGSVTTFLTSKIPLADETDEVWGLLGISIDISNLKRKEDQLKDLINITAIQNKKLLSFTHIISHNLRSHTANFTMLLNFLTQEKDEEEKEKIIEMLLDASDGLTEALSNLNQVLSVKDKVSLKKTTINLGSQINQVQRILGSFLKTNNATIKNFVPKNFEIKGVTEYVENILINFITNSVKYQHPDRSPVIVIEVEKSKGITLIHVRDNGMGIDLTRHKKKLFGMYKTFHNNVDARGIGLYICKNQAEAMDCDIFVESEVNVGSTFTLCFNE
ncbi:PAS domain-containing sensor histidine kinase [Croceivirga thetidis]|uniref:histidine kinase n=1 Tax=Croceivirga thetidis TaxID=2721623 RepID=A0ABX1GTU8_9FLAO|nr:PAS domain S-box protein [Croceivirga thetidis]NKI33380.1 PAS domain S-box protein [Croceivirga thetidis]